MPMLDEPGDPLRLARKAETVLRGRTDRVLLVLEGCTDDLNHIAVLRTCESMGVHRVFLIEAPSQGQKHYGQAKRAKGPAEAESSTGGGSTAAAATASARGRRRLAARAVQRGLQEDALLGGKAARLYCTYLDVRTFADVHSCVAALRADRREIWATDLAQCAEPLLSACSLGACLPRRLAVVMGSEGDGVSAAFLAQADKRVYLPMRGFTESYNLSVASALVLQRLLDAAEYEDGHPDGGGLQGDGCRATVAGGLQGDELGELRRDWYQSLARTHEQRARFEQLAAAGGVEPFADRDLRRPEAFRNEKRRVQQPLG